MKGLEVVQRGRGFSVTYKGQKCKRIGSGSFRIVYEIPNTGKVVKVQRAWSDRDNEVEYETYKTLSKQVKGCLARVYAPLFKNDIAYVVQDKVEGLPLNRLRPTSKRYVPLYNKLNKLCVKTKLCDLHEGNVVISKRTGKLVIVDMGHGVGEVGDYD